MERTGPSEIREAAVRRQLARPRVPADAAILAASADLDQRDERAALVAFSAARADEEFFTEHAERDPEYQSLLTALRSRSRRLPADLRWQYRAMQVA